MRVSGTENGRRPWSLQRQIVVLGLLAVATVAGAVLIGVQVLHQTETARVGEAARQLEQVARQLVESYVHLRASVGRPASTSPLQGADDRRLRSLTETGLRTAAGVEGGYYDAGEGRLLGYAFPSYQGSGPKTDVPSAERPTILRVAREAVASRRSATEEVVSGSDVILFRARPIMEDDHPVGAAWAMHRLNDVRGSRRQLYLLGLVVSLLAASASVAAAGLLTRRLGRGVTGIEATLRKMEHDVGTPVPSTGIVELDRIGSAIHDLGRALHDSTTRRTALEKRLRHADRLAVLGRIVAGVAHEVRNPLASIKLKLDLARRGTPDPERLAGTFEVVQAEVDRLDRLVERLLALGKPAEPDHRPTDLEQFIAERLSLWETRAADQGTELERNTGGGIDGPMVVDRDRLGQIMDNLVTNALEALGHGGSVRVEVGRPTPAEVTIAVEDTGPGIPKQALDHLFEPFFTTKEAGTGLGLFLSAELARRLGGELRYRRPPAGGARFEVSLPC